MNAFGSALPFWTASKRLKRKKVSAAGPAGGGFKTRFPAGGRRTEEKLSHGEVCLDARAAMLRGEVARMSDSALKYRRAESSATQSEVFDVAVIGGGVTGACLFHELRKKGFRVLLADKSDFAGGTSQASGMMLWGGLLYLRNFDLLTVYRLCSSRDAMVRGMRDWVQPRPFRYIVSSPGPGNRMAIQSALYLYWLLGGCRRLRPRLVRDLRQLSILKAGERRNCFEYEEAYLPDSDARFVIQWILRARDAGNPALNYCAVRGGGFDLRKKEWTLDVEDLVLGRPSQVRARLVVNAAGVWADRINDEIGIRTPFKHVFSKGVFLGVRRHPAHETPLIVDRGQGDCVALIPWGPISLWGPTETVTTNLQDGFSVTAGDVSDLAEVYSRHFSPRLDPEDIVSLRCGVRGLAVPSSTRDVHQSLTLSRGFVVHRDDRLPWVTIHGGKLTSCVPIAHAAIQAIEQCVRPAHLLPLAPEHAGPASETETFPGLQEKVPSARACASESCWSLQDYLRRRTNIAQWVPRAGLGRSNENTSHLERLAAVFATRGAHDPRSVVAAYRKEIETKFDRIIGRSPSMAVPMEVL